LPNADVRLRGWLPRSFQARLTVAVVAVIALALGLVTVLVINRLDDYFTNQQVADLRVRSSTVSVYVRGLVAERASARPVVGADGRVDPAVVATMNDPVQRELIADRLGQADVTIRFGFTQDDGQAPRFIAAPNGEYRMSLEAPPSTGQTREPTAVTDYYGAGSVLQRYTLEITLGNPYTYRATAIANLSGLLAAIALLALGLAVIVSAALARRFTTPLRQLTDASRALAEGNLASRVPTTALGASSSELGELALQFNTMAERLAESVELSRRDRDRSRDFLADVSHEFRTPLAALRTFNQLLIESAGDDPEARAEFLESSAGQIERLDWLAQNLLELSKLDSGLVLLDLRPDDLRAAVESAVQQNDAVAARRGVALRVDLSAAPIRVRHDPPRVGQVVSNLVANALKFTPRGGTVSVAVAPTGDGARIEVADTGVGIEPAELPHIFERFYRGSRLNEVRGSGSGLGLAIVRSIVDMHGGSISVESGPGGTRFQVHLPNDPRHPEHGESPAVTETSPSEAPQVNPPPPTYDDRPLRIPPLAAERPQGTNPDG